jgi:hypothetical protein
MSNAKKSAQSRSANQKFSFGSPTSDMAAPAWQSTVGSFISGQAEVDENDLVAIGMEAKWGVGRLRLLVGPALREKFDRQRYLLNQALWHGELQDVIREAKRMSIAWRALDTAAEAAGAASLSPEVWECTTGSGAAYAIVKTIGDARAVTASGRHVKVYTLDEIARLIAGFPSIARVKEEFPGAEVEHVRTHIADPLDAVPHSRVKIDDTESFRDNPPF